MIIDKETRLSLADQLFQMEFDLVLTDIFPNMLTKAKKYQQKKRFVKGNCFEKLLCELNLKIKLGKQNKNNRKYQTS